MNLKFYSWFVGFFEGAGSFVIHHNRVYLCFYHKDLALLSKIQQFFSCGRIIPLKKKKAIIAYRLSIKNPYILQEIWYFLYYSVQLKRSKEILDFVKKDLFSSIIRSNLKQKNRHFPYMYLLNRNRILYDFILQAFQCHQEISNSSWLSGIFDAVGFFHIKYQKDVLFNQGSFINSYKSNLIKGPILGLIFEYPRYFTKDQFKSLQNIVSTSVNGYGCTIMTEDLYHVLNKEFPLWCFHIQNVSVYSFNVNLLISYLKENPLKGVFQNMQYIQTCKLLRENNQVSLPSEKKHLKRLKRIKRIKDFIYIKKKQ